MRAEGKAGKRGKEDGTIRQFDVRGSDTGSGSGTAGIPGGERLGREVMTITAKFASSCPTCGGKIRKGEQINWERGKPAQHVQCAPQAEHVSQEDYPCSDRGYEDQCADWYRSNY